MVLANSELPLDWAPVTACEERVGTVSPTLMKAGMESVAMSRGVETTLVRPEPSWAVSKPKSWRLWPTSAPADRVVVAPSNAPINARAAEEVLPGTAPGLVAPTCCSQA